MYRCFICTQGMKLQQTEIVSDHVSVGLFHEITAHISVKFGTGEKLSLILYLCEQLLLCMTFKLIPLKKSSLSDNALRCMWE
jgi:hypothetical protein